MKTRQFGRARYVGDPVNAVRIFNEKEVDELAILDIGASREGRSPDYDWIGEIAGEAFMPVAYGGGVRSGEEAARIFACGIEKVVLNTAAFAMPSLVPALADRFGSQSVVVSLDVKRNWLGRPRVWVQGGTRSTGLDPVVAARQMEAAGAGELILHDVDREGTGRGYDCRLVHSVARAVSVPVIALGGAAGPRDFVRAVREGGASAAMAGSVFVFQGPHRGILIQYPESRELERLFAGDSP